MLQIYTYLMINDLSRRNISTLKIVVQKKKTYEELDNEKSSSWGEMTPLNAASHLEST